MIYIQEYILIKIFEEIIYLFIYLIYLRSLTVQLQKNFVLGNRLNKLSNKIQIMKNYFFFYFIVQSFGILYHQILDFPIP